MRARGRLEQHGRDGAAGERNERAGDDEADGLEEAHAWEISKTQANHPRVGQASFQVLARMKSD
ncbi:MAG: hypothetical protein NVSMB23_17590 [Myxococcales bacterium]